MGDSRKAAPGIQNSRVRPFPGMVDEQEGGLMPFYFGKRSKKNLAEAHPLLQELFREVIKHYDCTIIEGYRGKAEQEKAVEEGRSKLHFPHSKHNRMPSFAVDAVPYHALQPHIRWDDREAFYHFAGFVLGIAASMGISIRWGGDWDSDHDLHDQAFMDLVHFELREK